MSPPAKLTVGIDARAAVEVKAGRGRLVRELLRVLAQREDSNRYLLYAREVWTGLEDSERLRWRLIAARDPWWHLRTARLADQECDVFLSTNSYLTPLFMRKPTISIVYDMIAFDPAMRPNRRSVVVERLTLGAAVRRCDALIAISQATADALALRFPRAASRTVVAPLGVTPALASTLNASEAAVLPPAGFVLAVGTLEPRKNLPRLIDAYRTLPEPLQRKHPLVVVGALGWETGETLRALQSLGERCKMLGHVSDAALAELYRRCAVFCYPSLGEGFGLPVLEAMSAGAPVLTSNVSSLPEVGGDAAAYADPRDAGEITRELRALLCDEKYRTDLSRRGPIRAAEFSWERFVTESLRHLETTASR
ncbi:MAG TPA: glycosyltransferase family 1 protein [Solirubrobacteraceae bacterium]|nr:glycosyltransferase family 1 protein [Solirubrobacteraceae bacterium]